MSVISSKVQIAVEQGLAFSGLVVLESRYLFTMRPDLWVAAHNASSDFQWQAIENYLARLSPPVKVFQVLLAGSDEWLRVAARSDDRLAERIGWITGLEVVEQRDYQEQAAGTADRRLVASGVDEIPDYPCQARTDALAKRGLSDTKFPGRAS